MFIQPYKHPLYRIDQREKYRNRWIDSETNQETESYKTVIALINEGAGKHFLNDLFYRNRLPELESDLDLKGLKLWKIELDFGDRDNFKGISFAHGEWWHCNFINCVFYSCDLDFLEAYGCTFNKCAFVFTHFIGAKFRNCNFIDCDFGEPCSWENGEFINTVFESCFLGQTTPFSDCYFDDRTKVTNMRTYSPHFGQKVSMPNEALSGFFNSFLKSYEASGSVELENKYFWEARKAFTRYNTAGSAKILSLANELVTGYGRKPLRPLAALFLVHVVGVLIFSIKVSFADSLLLTAGALFTFGAGTTHLEQFGVGWRLFYIFLAFFGVTGTAVFITTLANLWFSSKVPTPTVKTSYNK